MKNTVRRERGSTLMMVVVVFAVVLLLGTGIMAATTQSHRLAIGQADKEQAYYAAKTYLDTFVYKLTQTGMTSQEQQELMNTLIPITNDYIRSEISTVKDEKNGQTWNCYLEVKASPLNGNKRDYHLTSVAKKSNNPDVMAEVKAVIQTDLSTLNSNSGETILSTHGGAEIELENDYGVYADKIYSRGGEVEIETPGEVKINTIHSHGDIEIGDDDRDDDGDEEEYVKSVSIDYMYTTEKVGVFARKNIGNKKIISNKKIELTSTEGEIRGGLLSTNQEIIIDAKGQIEFTDEIISKNKIELWSSQSSITANSIESNEPITLKANEGIKVNGNLESKKKIEILSEVGDVQVVDVKTNQPIEIKGKNFTANEVGSDYNVKIQLHPGGRINVGKIEAFGLDVYTTEEDFEDVIRDLKSTAISTWGQKYTVHAGGRKKEISCPLKNTSMSPSIQEPKTVPGVPTSYGGPNFDEATLRDNVIDVSGIPGGVNPNIYITNQGNNLVATYMKLVDGTFNKVEKQLMPDIPYQIKASNRTNVYFGKNKNGQEIGIDGRVGGEIQNYCFYVAEGNVPKAIEFINNKYINYSGVYSANQADDEGIEIDNDDDHIANEFGKELTFNGKSSQEPRYATFVKYE